MIAEHAAAFEEALTGVLDLYGRPSPSHAVLRAWWAVLAPFPWEQVQRALAEHARACKFAPTPADIVERLHAADGRPGAETAWALALRARDEALTVVWTAEVAEAFGIARPVLDAGDEVGARKAFLEAYRGLVAEARRQMRPAAWTASLGLDPQCRADALSEALRRGQLSEHWRTQLLPERAQSAGDCAQEPSPVAGLLAGSADGLPAPERRRFLQAVREGLRQGAAARAAAEQEHEATAEARRVDQDQRRAAQRAALERLRRQSGA